MFEKEAEEYIKEHTFFDEEYGVQSLDVVSKTIFKDGAEFGYNKANEWHYVKDGDLPKQDGHTCFSIEVLADNKKWVHYRFDFAKWFCGNKEVRVIAWKEIVLPKEIKENDL